MRLSSGLCVSCLLRDATSPAAETGKAPRLEEILRQIELRDSDFRIGQYDVLEEIGRGGMGVIYKARHQATRRIVALKRVLGYHADSSETVARFRREAEAAASLDHPNILPIYEVADDEEGVPYFTMKYASGGSLLANRQALRSDPRHCVWLVMKVARAVHYAHSQGVLHRDLKPGNILLDGWREPMVSDFGLAKWLDAATDLTRTLTIFGTPGYIAPEQAYGRGPQLGAASDIYSLGAILFDLLAGRPPFIGDHALAVMKQAEEHAAPKLRTLTRTTDRDLETICAKCLESDPRLRYRSAEALADDLQRWLEGRTIVARPVSIVARGWRWTKQNPILAGSIAAIVVAVAAALGLQAQSKRFQANLLETQLRDHSLGVLPFVDLDQARVDNDLAASFVQEEARRLNNFGAFRVTRLAGGDSPTLEIHTHSTNARPQARALLAGTVRTLDGRARVAMRLIDATTNEVLYRKVFVADTKSASAAAISESVSQPVGDILLSHDWNKLKDAKIDPGLRNPDARDLITSGRELAGNRVATSLRQAEECYRRALAIEPRSGAAWAYLATLQLGRLYVEGMSALPPIAEEAGRKAVALAPDLGDAHRALANILAVKGDNEGALEELLKVTELDGVREPTVALLSQMLRAMGRPVAAIQWFRLIGSQDRAGDADSLLGDCWADLGDEARAEQSYQHLINVRPDLADGWMGVCHLRLLRRDFAEARRIAAEHLDIHQEYRLASQCAAEIAFFARDYPGALDRYRALAESNPDGGADCYGRISNKEAIGTILLFQGDTERGEALLKECLASESAKQKLAPKNSETLYRLAATEASLGLREQALQHLTLAAEHGWLDYRALQIDPRFDSVANHEEFNALIHSISEKLERMRQQAFAQ